MSLLIDLGLLGRLGGSESVLTAFIQEPISVVSKVGSLFTVNAFVLDATGTGHVIDNVALNSAGQSINLT